LRLVLTTRNESDILQILKQTGYDEKVKRKALESFAHAKKDVERYVNYRLDNNECFEFSPEQRDQLVRRCAGWFIFASIACDLLDDAYLKDQSLDDILFKFTSLDALYHTAISAALRSSTSSETRRATQEELKKVLGTILVAREPLSISSIAELAQIPLGSVRKFIGRLGSILASNGVHDPVYILHNTFTEFLVRQTWVPSPERKLPNEYAIGRLRTNRLLAKACLVVLSKQPGGLNIGNLYSPCHRIALNKSYKMVLRRPLQLPFHMRHWLSYLTLYRPCMTESFWVTSESFFVKIS
jgi:hypothetical protein